MPEWIDKVKAAVAGSKNALLVCHDYPDPDCLASAAGVQVLLKNWKIPSVITFGGFIGRPENRSMVQYLNIEALPLSGLDLADFDRVVFVDTQPGTGNHSLPKETRTDCAIDHHKLQEGTDRLPFYDVREDVGASSTIVTEYLRKAKIEISYKLATALYYGIKSDTQDLGRETNALDREVYYYLFTRIDHKLLSQIENPALDLSFFKSVTSASDNLEIYEQCGWCYLSKINRPDLVAEMADLLIRIEGVDWMLCLGYLKGTLYFSIRTKTFKGEAGEVARRVANGETGTAGGHGQIAAGRIDFGEVDESVIRRMKKRYLDNFSISEESLKAYSSK